MFELRVRIRLVRIEIGQADNQIVIIVDHFFGGPRTNLTEVSRLVVEGMNLNAPPPLAESSLP
ncbi:MAG: hypothetical protein CO013_07405 [Syntrophobacterales bacterium CG_4_8_14_3_um_filter_58_8]|nr:MAG: hypothetical protein AUK26_10245 [Syntrophaceae bacterium CG2_30_58_14]PIV07264.1 MAG: hypothetical protein COS57_00550 [Syntrophobacterales bacterium CG03_land_8_20_14_0_80_58_14]PJC73173.1 MAG: hypothetical protein CO013_07405 [Syntrophobacterales bacterium CG_4_8_14_3_um_filter_58_8]